MRGVSWVIDKEFPYWELREHKRIPDFEGYEMVGNLKRGIEQ